MTPIAVPAPERRRDRGFTLVEILVAIVLVGILSAVVVVGVGNLTHKGNTSACSASLDASKAASSVYFTSTGAFPTTFDQLLDLTPPALTLPTGIARTATSVGGGSTGWTLTMTPGPAGAAPSFVCS